MTRAQWSERVRRWRSSGRTAREFSAREGCNPRTLLWWSSTLGRAASDAPSFIELALPVSVAAPSSTRIEIVVRDGLRITVGDGFDAALLRRVVTALETR